MCMMNFFLFRYLGGKGKLVLYFFVVLQMNNFEGGYYVELFVGGVVVVFDFLFLEKVKQIYINDIDINVYLFWYLVLNQIDVFVD